MDRYDLKGIAEGIEIKRSEFQFPKISPPVNIQIIMNHVQQGQITTFDSVTLYGFAVELAQYALYLAIEINRLQAKAKCLESNLKHIVGKNLENAVGFTFQEKDHSIRANDNLAASYEEAKLSLSAQIDTFNFVDRKVSFVAELIRDLARNKGMQRLDV